MYLVWAVTVELCMYVCDGERKREREREREREGGRGRERERERLTDFAGVPVSIFSVAWNEVEVSRLSQSLSHAKK